MGESRRLLEERGNLKYLRNDVRSGSIENQQFKFDRLNAINIR
jgi:hypothetical protein